METLALALCLGTLAFYVGLGLRLAALNRANPQPRRRPQYRI